MAVFLLSCSLSLLLSFASRFALSPSNSPQRWPETYSNFREREKEKGPLRQNFLLPFRGGVNVSFFPPLVYLSIFRIWRAKGVSPRVENFCREREKTQIFWWNTCERKINGGVDEVHCAVTHFIPGRE